MPTTYNIFDLQVYDRATGKAVISTGGKAIVVATGAYAKSTLVNPDSDYASLTNPISATRGKFRFAIANTGLGSPAVDVFGYAPGGQAFFVKNIKPAEVTDIWIDSNQLKHNLVIPFSITNTTAATETDTGLDLVTGATVLPWPCVDVRTADSGITMDVGTLSSESGGDADGFIVGLSVASAVVVQSKLATTATLGALSKETVTDSGAATVAQRHPYTVGSTAVSITYTLSSGADTAEGYIRLPYVLKS